MKKQTAIVKVKLVAVLVICGAGLFAEFRATGGAEAQTQRSFELVGVDVPLEKRVGVDDGAAFVIHFGGDTHGNLDTCG